MSIRTQTAGVVCASCALDAADRNPAQGLDRRIGINRVRRLCADVSQMTIWRWLQDDALGFPRPIYIGRRRYWKEAQILAWLESRQK